METKYGSTLLTYKNAKTIKGEDLGYRTAILYLAPASESASHGGGNLCPMASEGCKRVCLFSAGRGRFDAVRDARIKKTVYFFQHRDAFLADLASSLAKLRRDCTRLGLKPACRLNGTSDYPFFRMPLLAEFPDVRFYNYTKIPQRVRDYLSGKLPKNEHLTFSRSEENEDFCEEVLAKRGNVAVVFDTKVGHPLPKRSLGARVIDGDLHDLRFLDPRGVVVGLRAKGLAKADQSGFVVRVGK